MLIRLQIGLFEIIDGQPTLSANAPVCCHFMCRWCTVLQVILVAWLEEEWHGS